MSKWLQHITRYKTINRQKPPIKINFRSHIQCHSDKNVTKLRVPIIRVFTHCLLNSHSTLLALNFLKEIIDHCFALLGMNLCLLTEKCHFICYFRIATGTWIASSKLNFLCYIQTDGENCRFFFRSKCVSWGFSYWLIVVSFLWFNNENPDIYFSSLSHKSLHKEIQVFFCWMLISSEV